MAVVLKVLLAPKATPKLAPLDEVRADETQQYMERLSNYAKGALTGLNHNGFHLAIQIGNRARRPFIWFVHYLMKKRPDCEPKGIARLVWGKAERILQDRVSPPSGLERPNFSGIAFATACCELAFPLCSSFPVA